MNLNEFQHPIMNKLYSTEASVRTEDVTKYFSMSGPNGIDNPSHYPIIVIGISEDGTPSTRALTNKNELLALPDETQCIGQWRGENRSDFFKFTARQYKEHISLATKHVAPTAPDQDETKSEPQDRLTLMMRDAIRFIRNDKSLEVRLVTEPQRAE